jgi:hypothetical protein
MLEVLKGNELDNVTLHVLLEALRVERLIVSVEHVHGAEIGFTYSDNDDAQWKLRTSYNLVNCFFHVIDDAICQD